MSSVIVRGFGFRRTGAIDRRVTIVKEEFEGLTLNPTEHVVTLNPIEVIEGELILLRTGKFGTDTIGDAEAVDDIRGEL